MYISIILMQVFGFCLPRNSDDNLWVAMVTELGEAVDFIKLLQMSWEDRLRVSTVIFALISIFILRWICHFESRSLR